MSSSRLKALAAASAAMTLRDAAWGLARNGPSAKIPIGAGGGGKASNVDIVGRELRAKGNVSLVADNRVNLLAAQDSESQHSQSGKLQSASACGTIGAGAGFSASLSQSKVHNDFASVQEQSGIRAGDGGFQLQVTGNADLKGGVISSSEQAIQDGRNSLATGTLTFRHSEPRHP
jgi:hypothetical protein